MIKGIAIFGAGTVFGHVITKKENPETRAAEVKLAEASADFFKTMKAIAVDAWLDVKKQQAEAKEKAEQDEDETSEEAQDKPENEETPKEIKFSE